MTAMSGSCIAGSSSGGQTPRLGGREVSEYAAKTRKEKISTVLVFLPFTKIASNGSDWWCWVVVTLIEWKCN